MASAEKSVRQSVSLSPRLAKRVRAIAKARRASTSRVLVDLIETGIESKEAEKERFFDLARRFKPAVDAAWGKPLVMNVSMPIAAVLLDLDFPSTMIKAIPLLARTGGLLAHLAEEQVRPIGFLMASHAEEAIAYDGGGDG